MSTSEVESVPGVTVSTSFADNADTTSCNNHALQSVSKTVDVSTLPRHNDLEITDNCDHPETPNSTLNESESGQMSHRVKENEQTDLAVINEGDHSNIESAQNPAKEVMGNSSSDHSRNHNTYDVSHNSDGQEMSDIPTDESSPKSSKEIDVVINNVADADHNSSFTEDSSDSLENDCYEAEDETDARIRSDSNSEDHSSDSYNGVENLESENNSLENETPINVEFSIDVQKTNCIQTETRIENKCKEQQHVSNSPKIVQKNIHDRPSFKNRIGSLRRNKKNDTEFSIEIFESKRPIHGKIEDQLGNYAGSTDCLTQTQMLKKREERAHSEPPELETAGIVPNFRVNFPSTTSTKADASSSYTSVEPIAAVAVFPICDNIVGPSCAVNCVGGDKSALETSVGSGIDPSTSLGSVALDGSTTLSQTSESSSGVTGELTSSGKVILAAQLTSFNYVSGYY